jgi:predicted PurR-regulated permease PerM
MKESLQVPLLLIVLSLPIWTWVLGTMGAILGVSLTVVLLRVYREFTVGGEGEGA